MKIAVHMAVTTALVLALLSGLCAGCAQAGSEHKCCRETEQAPSCHTPKPSEKGQCKCPDTGRILAAAVEAKKSVKQTIEPVGLLPAAGSSGIDEEAASGSSWHARPMVLPPRDLLKLNSILRI